MLNINFDTSGIDAALDKFAAKVQGDVIISGAAAAAREFYDEARERVPVQTGKLRDAIYRTLSRDNTTPGRAVYHVSWNKRKAPHGHLVEFGTSRAPAHPFLRPAYEAAKYDAAAAAIVRMKERLADA